MVDIEKIKNEIVALENLSAEEYCREKVEEIYAEFEDNKQSKIHDLKTALHIFDEYQLVEEESIELERPQEESVEPEQPQYDEFGNIKQGE